MLPWATTVLHPFFWDTHGDSTAKWHHAKDYNLLRKVPQIMWHKSWKLALVDVPELVNGLFSSLKGSADIHSHSDHSDSRLMCLVEAFLICQALWFVGVQTFGAYQGVSLWVPKIRDHFLKCLWRYFPLSALLGQTRTSSSLRALQNKCLATLPHTEGFCSGCNHDSIAYSKQIPF